MKKMIRAVRSGMAFNIIGMIILLLVFYGVTVSAQGLMSFTDAFKKEYSTTTYHMADTAVALISGDHLSDYLAGELKDEYNRTKYNLDNYCQRMNVSLIYVIQVDRTDYGRFVSIFNAVNNAVDDSSYTVWELGHRRDTTNDEYRQKYRAMYDQEALYETVYRTHPTDGQHPHITTMVPVKNFFGETVGILCMQRPISELNNARRPYLIRIGISTLVLAVLTSLYMAQFIHRQVLAPVRKVSGEAVRFARENTRGDGLGTISRYDEFSSLAASIDTMEKDMVNYIDNLTAATAEKERITTELDLARSIQTGAIPNEFPAFPDRKEFDIFATMDPVKEVGGDLYNFFLVDEDHLALAIGDVSGKGIPAALFMMITNILISIRARMGGTPSEVLTYVNECLCDNNPTGMFVTLWIGILEISTGRLISANAGHEDPAVCRKDGEFSLCTSRHGFVAGVMPETKYRDEEMQLYPGDRLFVYTDGIPEATDAHTEMFSLKRTVEALNRYRDGSPKEILEGVHQRVNDFVGDAPQFDDMTMLCLEIRDR